MKIFADIDIDIKDKNELLKNIECIEGTQSISSDGLNKHNSGVFFQDIPTDPFTGLASLHYKDAEELGYQKVDFLNNHAYDLVKDRKHLKKLMAKEPNWELLKYEDFVKELYHLNSNFEIVQKWSPTSIKELALLLAALRPAKKHLLQSNTWEEMETGGIWDKEEGDDYYLKRAHSYAYAHLIAVQMNAIEELLNSS